MSRLLFWLGDQFERGVRDDDWACDSVCYRVSQWLYRLGWKMIPESSK